jgi:hypothetical protein
VRQTGENRVFGASDLSGIASVHRVRPGRVAQSSQRLAVSFAGKRKFSEKIGVLSIRRTIEAASFVIG